MRNDTEEYPKDWIDKLTYAIVDDYIETDVAINYFLYGPEYLKDMKEDPDGK